LKSPAYSGRIDVAFDPDAVREFERAGWERAADRYEASFATATRQFIPALLDGAGVGSGTRLLDVACGPGFVTAAAAERGAGVVGLDFSPAMLAVARARHGSLTFDQGDAEALPYPDAHFDAVVSNFGIHHVPHPVIALGEAHRMLRAGGRIAFSVWAAPAENVAWKLLFDAVARHGNPKASGAPAPGGGLHTATHCVDSLAAAGFTAATAETARGVWHHCDGAALVAALGAGTARMAALIAAQDPASLPAIAADIDAQAADWRDADGLALPLAAVVAIGRKL
jgi:SAM-dependent methyltransferase